MPIKIITAAERRQRLAAAAAAAGEWPPPPDGPADWFDQAFPEKHPDSRSLGGRRLVTRRVREVLLWGVEVALNADEDAVWCEGCKEWVQLDELRDGPTGHGFDRRPRAGVVRPLVEPEPDRKPPTMQTVGF